jgi:hypothetical protein
MLCLTGMNLHAQTSPFDPGISEEASLIHEHVNCFTDRSLYITEEVIRFSARVQTVGLPDNSAWSSVLYVELISADGEGEASGKFPVQNKLCIGEIAIPGGILTGNYYLRCYTRWMRNGDAAAFSYIPLRIINPHRPELSGESAVGSMGERLSPRTAIEGAFEFSRHSDTYNRGDTVSMGIDTGTNIEGSLDVCITVVPLDAKPAASVQISGTQSERMEDFKLSYLPDLYGATLSGSVLHWNEEVNLPLADARIHFTLMGDQSAYFVARSDAYGKFSVTLPNREGVQELLVQPESEGYERVEVRIDRDFDQRYLPLSFEPFQLSESEESLLNTMARKVQLSMIYDRTKSAGENSADSVHVPFYGSPTLSVNLDEYVLLPSLKEVFISLVPGVTPVNRNDRDFLIIESENPSLNTLFHPLLMIDEVPLFDKTQFMSVPPEKISRIDVIDDLYLKGDLWFGGIINLHSKQKDIGGIDLPGDAFFFDFQAMYPASSKEEVMVSKNDRMPDTRNTLLWIPAFQIEKDLQSTISFVAPDYPGDYVVLFRGVDEKGELISAESVISVR